MNAVVLISGGMDSTVAAYLARKDIKNGKLYGLTVDYGQLAIDYEIEAAYNVARELVMERHAVANVVMPFGNPLTGIGNIESSTFTGIPNTWVPQRNSIFLALAYGYAETVDADSVYVGFAKGAYSPDCSPHFTHYIEIALNYASKSFVESGKGIGLIAPLVLRSKPEIIQKGFGSGVDFAKTRTCYGEGELACGVCPGCRARLQAFSDLGITDPLKYKGVECQN